MGSALATATLGATLGAATLLQAAGGGFSAGAGFGTLDDEEAGAGFGTLDDEAAGGDGGGKSGGSSKVAPELRGATRDKNSSPGEGFFGAGASITTVGGLGLASVVFQRPIVLKLKTNRILS